MLGSVLRLVGSIQLVLGLLYLFGPAWLLQAMGHSAVAEDIHYPLGMLAARFLAYGAGLWGVARQPQAHRFWIGNMIAIQLIDLAVGLAYTIQGVLPLSLSGFPMANALWISLALAVGLRQLAGQRIKSAS